MRSARRGLAVAVAALSLLTAVPAVALTVPPPVLGPDQPPVTSAPTTIAGASVVRSAFGTRPQVVGTASPDQVVTLFLRRRGTTAFVAGESTVSGASGVWRLSYTANDDYEYVAKSGTLPASRRVVRVAMPVVDRLVTRTIGGVPRVVVVGRAVPGTRVVLSYRLATDPAGAFPRVAVGRGTASSTYAVVLPRQSTTTQVAYSVRSPGTR